MLQDVEDGAACISSTSSDDEDETIEDISESHEKTSARIPAMSKVSESSNNKIPKPNAHKKPKVDDKIKRVNTPTTTVSQIVLPLSSQTQTPYSLKESSVNTVVSSSIPLLVPSTLEIPVPASLVPSAVSTAAQIHAVPLLVQTSAGLGYATTHDGMFVGILQGPNINQPQFVAIPVTNVTTTVGHNILKKTGDNKSS